MTAINTEHYTALAEQHLDGDGERSWTSDKGALAYGLQGACQQISEQREYIDRLHSELKDAESVGSREHALRLHYGCVVLPVSEYCAAFDDWLTLCLAPAWQAFEQIPEGENWHSPPPLYEIRGQVGLIRGLGIGKSDYLRRRIYAREPHRTEQCPVHKGRWSGIKWPLDPPECPCQDPDGNVSGWLPEPRSIRADDSVHLEDRMTDAEGHSVPLSVTSTGGFPRTTPTRPWRWLSRKLSLCASLVRLRGNRGERLG